MLEESKSSHGAWAIVVGASLMIPGLSSAQIIRMEGDAVWAWEASLDAGTSWQRGVIHADASVRSVEIRAWCEWSPIPDSYFGGIAFDGTVTGVGGAGGRDSVVNIRRRFGAALGSAATRFGNIIKIDDPFDFAEPGRGPSWITLAQTIGQRPYQTINPIVVFQYTLLLDGSVGDRLVDAIYASGFPPDRFISIGTNWTEPIVLYYPQVTNIPLTVRVVPAPATGFGLLVVFAGLRRRRR